ncbi:MAG TPA: hypothetical protein VGE46_03745 [Bdellovibrio sp.]
MFSKKTFNKLTAAVLATAITLTGCDSKVGEEPPPPTSQEFAGTQCLSEAKPVVKSFMEGTATVPQLENSWDCVSSVVEKFKRYVRGRTADRYTVQELATFLETNFLNNSKDQKEKLKISPALQTEFMKIKQIFIGGGQEYITRAEIDKLIVLFKNLRQITVGLNPYMKVIALKWTPTGNKNIENDIRYFEEANQELQNGARNLAASIEANGIEYKLSDFVAFTQELSSFFDEDWQFPNSIEKYMPVIKKVKKALAGGDEDLITTSEWRRFLNLGARGYVQYLRYFYFIQSVPETGSGYRLSYLARTVEDVLSVFQDLVAEKPEGVVSRPEVYDLLSTLQVVFPDLKVSEALVLEFMKIKQLFFGGSVDSFTSADFGTARLKVSRIKILVERFMPYYSIYGGEWDPSFYDSQESQKLFMESQFVLESTVREAGVLFEGSYDLKDLEKLFTEIERLYPPGDGSFAATIQKYMDLAVTVKNIVFASNDSSLRKSDWSVLLGFSARFYSDYLYYDYFLKGQSFEKPLTLSYFSVLVNQSLNILRDLLNTKANGPEITRAQINNLYAKLMVVDLVPKLTTQAVDQVVGVVLNNIFVAPEQRIAGYRPNALTVASIEVVREEAQVWLDTELFILGLSENWHPEEGLKAKELISVLQLAGKGESSTPYLVKGIEELLLSVTSPVPMTVDQEGRLIISKFEFPYTRKSLRQQNINRGLTRLLLRSFVNENARITSYTGAVLPEVETAFVTLKPILVELKLIEESNTGFASARFREANMFTPHADGNALASYAEISDLVGMIFSGFQLNSLLKVDLVAKCTKGPSDSKTSVTINCARDSYRATMPTIMTATPEYLAFMKKASKDQWSIYMENVFKSAGYLPNKDQLVRLEDISLAPHVMQYIEMVFLRFDGNKDGVISVSDAEGAFPVFRGILRELAADQLKDGTLKEEDLFALFTFILRYGKPPETIWEKARFLSWRNKVVPWDVKADRVQLASILGFIADAVAKTAAEGKAPANGGMKSKAKELESTRLNLAPSDYPPWQQSP